MKNIRSVAGVGLPLLAANAWYMLAAHAVPDGRLAFLLPVTSLFMVGIAVIAVRSLESGMTMSGRVAVGYGMTLALLFALLAPLVERVLQDVRTLPVSWLVGAPLLATVPVWSYVALLSVVVVGGTAWQALKRA